MVQNFGGNHPKLKIDMVKKKLLAPKNELTEIGDIYFPLNACFIISIPGMCYSFYNDKNSKMMMMS